MRAFTFQRSARRDGCGERRGRPPGRDVSGWWHDARRSDEGRRADTRHRCGCPASRPVEHRRVGACGRRRRGRHQQSTGVAPGRARSLPGAVGSHPVGRHDTDPQHGDGRRQHPAADALLLFQRCSRVVQPQTARIRLRCARRLQPRPRRAGRQRPLHCHASIRHVRGDGRSRCRRAHGAARWHHAFDSVSRLPPSSWRHAARRSSPRARRTDHPHRHFKPGRLHGARTISR